MANELHQKISPVEAALDFDTVLNSLAAADVAWCAPVTTLEDCERAEVTMAITVGGTSPEGTIEYYIARDTGTLIVADHHITLTDHGSEGTAADIEDILGDCDMLDARPVNGTASIVYTHRFTIWHPGSSLNIIVYNNTDEAFAASGHSGYIRGWLPEMQ